MAKGISVAVASDTRQFQAGVKSGMIDPLVQADDTLAKLGDTGQRAGDELQSSMRDQQTATQQLRGDIDQLNRQVSDGSSRAAGSMKTSHRQAAHEVEAGFGEMKDSARQNAVETAASFTGGFDQIAGGVQGMASEFLAAFGPAGVVAGLALAGGIGMLTNAVDQATAATEADKQAVADLAKQWIDEGIAGKNSIDDQRTAIENMATATDPSTVVITLQEAWKQAQIAGADYADVVKSIATSDPASIQKALDSVTKLRGGYQGALTSAADYANDPNASLTPKIVASNKLADALRHAKTEATDAGRAQELAAEAGLSKFALKADAVKQLHDAYADAAGEVDAYKTKEHGLFEVGKYIKAMEQRQKALREYQKTLSESSLSAGAKSYLESLGESDAATYMAGYAKASPKQKAQLDAIWTTAGKSGAQNYKDALGEKLSDVQPAPKIAKPVVPAPDTALLDAFLRKRQTLTLTVRGVTRDGKPVF